MADNASCQNMDIQYPVLNHEESIANIALNVVSIKNDNATISITNVLDVCRNYMFLIVENKGDNVSTLIVKAGDAYPNSMLGDIVIELAKGFSAINLADLPRFVRADGSVVVEFKDDFVGKVFAIGKYKFKENDRVEW